MAPFALLDSPASSAFDPAAVRLEARAPGLIADLDEGHYFTT